jgi:hypothetical protein
MAPLNNAAEALTIYPFEGRPHAHILGTGPRGERITAECGGCIAEEVEGLYQTVLDLMDTIADQLTAHAELRRKLETQERFGL